MLKGHIFLLNLLFVVLFVNSCGLIKDAYIKNLDYPQPTQPTTNATIIDLTTLKGHSEDYVKVHSFVRNVSFVVIIWIHDRKTNIWKEYGSANLKSFGDTDTVRKLIPTSIEDIKYVAIEFSDEENYIISAYKKDNDLHIDIRE